MNIEIFTTPTCPYCLMTKELLNQKKVSYVEHNVAVDEEARQKMVQISGQLGVPVIVIDEEVIVGFDHNALENALREAA